MSQVSWVLVWVDFDFCVPPSCPAASRFSQIPISPSRVGQTVEHSKSKSTKPSLSSLGTPCKNQIFVVSKRYCHFINFHHYSVKTKRIEELIPDAAVRRPCLLPCSSLFVRFGAEVVRVGRFGHGRQDEALDGSVTWDTHLRMIPFVFWCHVTVILCRIRFRFQMAAPVLKLIT